ncbi:MAG TPA: phage terminase large subunit [archaeon]|nr:phage terminase large subunit [archaeon]
MSRAEITPKSKERSIPSRLKSEEDLRQRIDALPPAPRDRALGRLGIGIFAKAFFPHYCRTEESGFHRELYNLITESVLEDDGSRIAVAAPRESAKSTIVTLFLPLWCICYPDLARKRYIIIASDTATQAERHIGDIKIELEDNGKLRESFPQYTGAGPLWTKGEIITNSGVKVTARGTGGNIRGLRHRQFRPDLLIGDDLENDRNSQTPAQRDKITDWFFKAFSKTGGKRADTIVIGTILHYDSLLSRLLKNPAYEGRKYRGVVRWSQETALWEAWERLYTDMSKPGKERAARADDFFDTHRAWMTAGTEVIWPAHRSYCDLMKLRVAEGPASFDSEIQNEPVNPRECLFQEEWFCWFEEEKLDLSQLTVVAAVDPSLGKEGKHSDPSAIVALGRDEKGALFVLDADIDKRAPDRIIEDTLELYLRRKPSVIGVETVQFQEFFKTTLEKEAAGRGIYPPVREITSTRDKKIRIQRLQPLVKNGTLRFQKKHKALYEQLRFFPKADHDDGPDALEMAVQLAELIAGPEQFRFDRPRTRTEHLKKVFG